MKVKYFGITVCQMGHLEKLQIKRLMNLGWDPKINLNYGLTETIKNLDVDLL